MFLIDITATTSPSEWKYLSEGGATVVFTYSGTSNDHCRHKVLRLRKGNNTTAATEDSLLFQAEIISQLVPRKHLVSLEAVTLTKSWLETLATLSTEARPAWRTGSIDTSCSQGLLASNLVQSPISIEIKPKWSFLNNQSSKSPTCRSCMHASCRGWKTSYCPLDLFSSSPERIKKALYALYDAWLDNASQNNLRLFIGGSVVPPGSENLLSALQQTLGITLHPSDLRDRFVQTLHTSLTQPESSSLLKMLKQLQRTLDGPGIQGLASLWTEINVETGLGFGEGCAQPTLDEWRSFVEQYLEAPNTIISSSEATQPSEKKLRYHILSYLLSATFKDCSIMIMLPGLSIDHTASSFPSRITLIDLDQKPTSRFKKWLEQDRQITRDYVRTNKTEMKVCIDD